MFRWIAENKQWLFSGIGVTVIIGGIRVLIWARSRGAAPSRAVDGVVQPAVSANVPEKTPTSPSGNEIAITVDQAPPFQRDQIGSNYVGLVVSWPVIVFSVLPSDHGRCIVTLAYGRETWGAKITVVVNIADYPRLKTAHDALTAERNRNTRIVHGWIDGRIVKCGSGGMEIQATTLEFSD